jgi:hypothetical protein
MRGECRVRGEESSAAMEAARAAIATVLSELRSVIGSFFIEKTYKNIPFTFTKYVSG